MLDCQAEAAANVGSQAAAGEEPKRKRTKLIGISEHMRMAEEKREQKNGPDSWAVRKVSSVYSATDAAGARHAG